MRRFELILFDADETLLDFRAAERQALAGALAKAGFACDQQVLSAYSVINKELWLAYERGQVDREKLQRLRFERLSERCGLQFDAVSVSRWYLEYLSDCRKLVDGALSVCRALCGKYLLAIVTNGISEMQKKRIAQTAVAPYIDHVFVSEDTGFVKPMPAFFDAVFRYYPAVGRDQALIVGDSLSADIAGGERSGIATCWYNPQRERNPGGFRVDYEITRLQELEHLLLS